MESKNILIITLGRIIMPSDIIIIIIIAPLSIMSENKWGDL